jgi:hypothetical protein
MSLDSAKHARSSCFIIRPIYVHVRLTFSQKKNEDILAAEAIQSLFVNSWRQASAL